MKANATSAEQPNGCVCDGSCVCRHADLQHPVLRRDLREVSADQLLQAAGLHGEERPDLLVGGSPGIAFSKSWFWLDYRRQGRDPDGGLLQAYTRVLHQTRPRAFLLENVHALTFKNRASRPAFEQLLQEIANAGYHHRWGVLNAANYACRSFARGCSSSASPREPAAARAAHGDPRRPLGGHPHRQPGPAARHRRPGPRRAGV